jgi:moderate conductance mechanosensitive channel
VTGLRFGSAFAQIGAYLVAAILYAHLVPELRAVGTALLAGDRVRLNSPKRLVPATLEFVSLGYTVSGDVEGDEIIVPNSVMVSNVVIRLGEDTASHERGAD